RIQTCTMKEKINKSKRQIKGEKNEDLHNTNSQNANNIKYSNTEEINLQTVADPLAEAGYSATADSFLAHCTILNKAAKKPESSMTSFEKINLIKEGISKTDLENLKDKAGLDYNQLSKVLS